MLSLVSDRAQALIKLGKAAYLNVISIPDLFHFVQDISRAIGCRIGRKRKHLQGKWSKCEDDQQKGELKIELDELIQDQKSYRKQIEQINKTVHPFDSQDEWQSKAEVEKSLLHCFRKISSIGQALKIDITLEKASKIYNQIPDIAHSIQAWKESIQEQIQEWVLLKSIPTLHRQWFEKYALPYAYWQVHFNKTQAKARDVDLRAYYRQRADNAQKRYEQNPLTPQLDKQVHDQYLDKAFRMAVSFQRSSSQVEGRNGYLAFVHHAHKGIPKQRLQVLTVVHNFDIRRADGSTPAQRLFQRPFLDLFEFLCQNVKGFAEPRKGKAKSLVIKTVQR